MSIIYKIIASVTFLAMTGLMMGCSSGRLSNDFQVGNAVANPKNSDGSALVAIRWPAAIDDKAKAMLADNWFDGNETLVMYGDPVSTALYGINQINPMWWLMGRPMLEAIVGNSDHLLDNSTYYAMEYYRQLSRFMPESEILLEPQLITVTNGALQLVPLVKNSLPVAFVFNFIELFPGATSEHSWLYPLFTITTAGAASPKTCGAVAGDYYTKLAEFNENACNKMSSRDARHSEVLDYYFSDTPKSRNFADVPVRGKLPLTPNELTIFPMVWEEFSEDYLAATAAPTFDSSKQQLQNKTLESLAKALVDGITRYDVKKTTQAGTVEYVVEYDKPLADRLNSGIPLSEEDQARIAVILQLADKEKQWITKQDKKLADSIIDGAFGKSFRATRLAYFNREQQQSQAGWEQVNTLAMSSINSGALTGQYNALAAMSTALNSAIQYQTALSEIEQNFYSQFGAELDARQRVLEVNIEGRTRTINASDRQSLRKELKQVYDEFVAGG